MAQKILVETWGDFGKIENLQEIMPVEMQMRMTCATKVSWSI